MIPLKKFQLYFLSVISGLLLSLAWFPNILVPLIFIAFVPLFIVENQIAKHPTSYKSLTLFFCSYLAFLIWNLLTTWWVKNASLGGASMAFFFNTLFMTTVFMIFHKTKKRVGEKWGGILFIAFWLSFEYIHISWDLTWPWLTLGNVFSGTPNWVQWYEYTGVFGGGLWVLVINYLLFTFFRNLLSSEQSFWERIKQEKLKLTGVVLLIVFPIVFSNIILASLNKPEGKTVNVVVVQPNVDPYDEKFIVNYYDQLKTLLQQASQQVDSTTDYLVFPETALTEFIWEGKLEQSKSIEALNNFIKQYPKLNVVVGASTAKVLDSKDDSPTSRKFVDAELYYDAFNTAFQFDRTKSVQIYHKSKLVPGVEIMPFPSILKHFEELALDLGGTTGSLGTQEERTVFYSADSTMSTAPVICYESVYGEYVAEYVRNGAQFISIITNDGWWQDTPGYRQLLKYGTLRAIENRRYIARSANVGVACFINEKGEILQPSEYDVPAVIKGEVVQSNTLTFYTRHGDYIAWAAIVLSVIALIYSTLLRFKLLKKE